MSIILDFPRLFILVAFRIIDVYNQFHDISNSKLEEG